MLSTGFKIAEQRLWLAAGLVLGAPLAIAGSWIAYSNFVIDHQVPLPPAIEAERATFAQHRRAAQLLRGSRRRPGGRCC